MKKSFIFAILAMVMLVFTGCKEVKEEKYSNGSIRTQTEFNSDGVKDGFHKEFAENGTLILSTKYINGLENGLRYTYDEKGTLLSEITIKDGKNIGYFKKYAPSESAYQEGIYDEDGEYLEVKVFQNDILVHEYKKKDNKIITKEYSPKTQKLIYEEVVMRVDGNKFTKKYTNDGILIYDENITNGLQTIKTYKKDPNTNKYYLHELNSNRNGFENTKKVFNPDGSVQSE